MKRSIKNITELFEQAAEYLYKNTNYKVAQEATATALVGTGVLASFAVPSYAPVIAFGSLCIGSYAGNALGRHLHARYNPVVQTSLDL